MRSPNREGQRNPLRPETPRRALLRLRTEPFARNPQGDAPFLGPPGRCGAPRFREVRIRRGRPELRGDHLQQAEGEPDSPCRNPQQKGRTGKANRGYRRQTPAHGHLHRPAVHRDREAAGGRDVYAPDLRTKPACRTPQVPRSARPRDGERLQDPACHRWTCQIQRAFHLIRGAPLLDACGSERPEHRGGLPVGSRDRIRHPLPDAERVPSHRDDIRPGRGRRKAAHASRIR